MDIQTISRFFSDGVDFIAMIVSMVDKLIPIVIKYPEASLVVVIIGYLKRNWIKRKVRQLLRYIMIGV